MSLTSNTETTSTTKVISFDVEMSRFIKKLTDPRSTGGAVYNQIICSNLDFNKSFSVKYECIFQDNVHQSYYVVLWGLIKVNTLTNMVNNTDILLQIRMTRKHLEVVKVPNFPPIQTVFNRRFSFNFEDQLEEHGDFYFGIGLWLNRINDKKESKKRFHDEIESEYCFLGDKDINFDDLPTLSDTEAEDDLPSVEDVYSEPDDPADFATYHRLNKTYLDY